MVSKIDEIKNEWINVADKKPENRSITLVNVVNNHGSSRVIIAECIHPKTVKAEDFIDQEYFDFAEYDEDADCYWAPSGYYECQDYTDINFFISDDVTHWMKLPDTVKMDNDNRLCFVGDSESPITLKKEKQ